MVFWMNVNLVAVVIAAVANMVIGMLWYSPMLFGKEWMKLSGLKESDVKKANMGQTYFFAFLTALVMSFVLAQFLTYAGAKTFLAGAKIGFWAWLGFIATTTASMVLWHGKPLKLYLLNNGHSLLSLLVMGVILAIWA